MKNKGWFVLFLIFVMSCVSEHRAVNAISYSDFDTTEVYNDRIDYSLRIRTFYDPYVYYPYWDYGYVYSYPWYIDNAYRFHDNRLYNAPYRHHTEQRVYNGHHTTTRDAHDSRTNRSYHPTYTRPANNVRRQFNRQPSNYNGVNNRVRTQSGNVTKNNAGNYRYAPSTVTKNSPSRPQGNSTGRKR